MKKAIKFTLKALLILVILLAVLLLGVFIYNRIMLGKEKHLISQPLGDMIEVDDGKMCVYTEGSGKHTIVFMSGYGTPSPISYNGAPDVPMLFFISKHQAKIQFPDDPDKYLQLYRNYTDNKQEYIDLDCDHYVHLQERDLIASEIRRFANEIGAE